MSDPYANAVAIPTPDPIAQVRLGPTSNSHIVALPALRLPDLVDRRLIVVEYGGDRVSYRIGRAALEATIFIPDGANIRVWVIDVGANGSRSKPSLSTRFVLDVRSQDGIGGGPGVPDDSYGVDGQWWINTDTADVYQKQNGTWA